MPPSIAECNCVKTYRRVANKTFMMESRLCARETVQTNAKPPEETQDVARPGPPGPVPQSAAIGLRAARAHSLPTASNQRHRHVPVHAGIVDDQAAACDGLACVVRLRCNDAGTDHQPPRTHRTQGVKTKKARLQTHARTKARPQIRTPQTMRLKQLADDSAMRS
jgi:hypothetical protein